VDSGRAGEIALYTGKRRLTSFRICLAGIRLASGQYIFPRRSLGQWAVWTTPCGATARNPFKPAAQQNGLGSAEILADSAALTDANAALFDVRNRLPAVSPDCTRSFGGKAYWRAAGVWIQTKTSLSGNWKESRSGNAPVTRNWRTIDFVRDHLDGWLK